jgi:hypothetical protein
VDPATDRNNCGACGNVCTLSCDQGTCGCGDAGGTQCGNECVDLQTDRFHCGSCDTNCAPDDCVAGHCSSCTDGGSCTTCAESFLTWCGGKCVDLDGDTDNCGACGVTCPASAGEIPVCALRECSAVLTLAQSFDSPVALTLDDSFVYWTTIAGAIHRVPKVGGASTLVLDPAGEVSSVAIAGDQLLCVRPASGSILRLAKDGSEHGSPTLLAQESGAAQIAVGGSLVYWGTSAGIRSIPIAGGSATTVLARTAPVSLVATDGVSLYWYEGSSTAWNFGLYSANVASPNPTLISKPYTDPTNLGIFGGKFFVTLGSELKRFDGPSPTIMYAGSAVLATDGSVVAWLDANWLEVAPFGGVGQRAVYEDAPNAAALGVASVAIDDRYFYLVRQSVGAIVRAAR